MFSWGHMGVCALKNLNVSFNVNDLKKIELLSL